MMMGVIASFPAPGRLQEDGSAISPGVQDVAGLKDFRPGFTIADQ
jgi:hypothetical protein